jgi:putative component of membrane protein insertase Oxa1/YidC/SpoIIIJ protein YidD
MRHRQARIGGKVRVASIRLYQRHLSPRKGFSCAHRGATGGASCSTYGYRAIARYGLRKGMRLLRRRLDACGRQHRFGGGPLSYQHGDCDPGIDADCCGDLFSGSCSLDWRRKSKQSDADFEALRARVEAAKRRNTPKQ